MSELCKFIQQQYSKIYLLIIYIIELCRGDEALSTYFDACVAGCFDCCTEDVCNCL